MVKPRLIFLVILLFSAKMLFAANPGLARTQNFQTHQSCFVENKGQLAQQPEIKYYIHNGGVNVYCRPGMISFVFSKLDHNNNPKISEATGTLSPAGGGRGWNPRTTNNQQPTTIS